MSVTSDDDGLESPKKRGSSRSCHELDSGAYHEEGEDITSPTYREIQRGPSKTIVGIVDGDGVCESYDYLESLNAADQAQFKARFERYTQVGYLRSPEEMRVIVEHADVTVRVHEIKTRNGHRLFGIQEESRFIASHGARKPKPRAIKKHAERARLAYLQAQAQPRGVEKK